MLINLFIDTLPINKEVVPMKQTFMWILFKMGLSLFTPDYMIEGREIDEHQEREALKHKKLANHTLASFFICNHIFYLLRLYCSN